MRSAPQTQVEVQIGDRRTKRRLVGWREWVGLPALNIPSLRAKVDTGARTSALHAVDVTPLTLNDTPCVSFAIPEEQIDGLNTVFHTAPVRDHRSVRGSTGASQERYVIAMPLHIGRRTFTIEITLSDRTEMDFPMLLGRNALRLGRYVVDPGRSFLQGQPRG